MQKVLFEINYSIHPEKREEYIDTIIKLKSLINEKFDINYSVFENTKKQNNFSEIFICNSEEELEKFDDTQDDSIREIISELFEKYIKDKKVIYTTKTEI
ncbi:MAG: hypothetical protein FJ216_01080 [Ignavibacteria bacterium]|nr:hypothetical protein [Ignavibacteria bacterium]